MAKKSEMEVCEAMEVSHKPSLYLSGKDIDNIKDMNLDDELEFTCTAKVTRVSKDTWSGKEKYNAEFELSDIKIKK